MQGKGSSAMANTDTEELTLLAKLVIATGIALMVAGVVSHPVTIATVDRIWYQELARASAPMKFRFVLQPLTPALAARHTFGLYWANRTSGGHGLTVD